MTDNAISVRQNPLWDIHPQFHLWQLRCDLCDDGMEFAGHAEAVAWAQRHAMKHVGQACPLCGNHPYIREDFR